MKTIQKIWLDIFRGENIDVYLTVIAAIVVAVLSIFNVTTQTLIQPLTLAILGLLAVSNIGNRYRMEQILEGKSRTLDTVFLKEFPDEMLQPDFENAKEIWLVGVGLRHTTHKHFHQIKEKVKNGCTVNVLLVHPDNDVLEMAEFRGFGIPNVERKRLEILGTIGEYSSLASSSNIKIRTIKYPLTHSILATNPNLASGRFYVSYHSFKVSGGSRPKVVIEQSDGYWYEFFKEELINLWSQGVEWNSQ